MNTKTLITIKTEKSLKELAQKTAQEIGIPLGTIINSLIKQFVRNKEVVLSVTNRPSAYLKQAIEDSEREIAEGNVSGPFTHDDFIKHLKKL